MPAPGAGEKSRVGSCRAPPFPPTPQKLEWDLFDFDGPDRLILVKAVSCLVPHPFMMPFGRRLDRVPVGIAWIGACAGAELLGMALAAGAFGIVQVLVLRPAAVGGFAAWILLNGLGWAAAFVVIFLGASAPANGASLALLLAAGAVTGVASGGVLGLATLPALNRLMPKGRVRLRRNPSALEARQ